MNNLEAAQLLTLAATYDGRSIEAVHPQAWAEIMKDVDYSHARTALLEYYRLEPTGFIRPAHIIGRVSAEKNRTAQQNNLPPAWVKADFQRYKAELAAQGLTPRQKAYIISHNQGHADSDDYVEACPSCNPSQRAKENDYIAEMRRAA